MEIVDSPSYVVMGPWTSYLKGGEVFGIHIWYQRLIDFSLFGEQAGLLVQRFPGENIFPNKGLVRNSFLIVFND